jgi:dinuclear metal center YbgI/SA1388 family protein
MKLDEVVDYLDGYLSVRVVRDAPDALNGLQVANDGRVTRIGAAVDASEATICLAVEQGIDLLLVHHGLFWGGPRPLTGPHFRRVAALIKHNVALYAAHLPLDCHAEVGNAAVLAARLGLAVRGGFGEWQGQVVGLWGETDAEREAFSGALAAVLGAPARLMAFGPPRVQRVGIATGSGGSLIPQAVAAGLDTFVTGEGAHHTYFDAEELGVNVYYGGHYLTETFGVKAVAAHLSERYSLPWVFLDHPTGL